jgi:hypothetical protein
MKWCYAFPWRRFIRCPPRHLAVEDLLTQLLRHYTSAVRWIIRCWRLLTQGGTVCFKYNRQIDWRFPLTKALVHPVLKTSSWCVSVLIQTERQIDRRCPHLDRRIIRCYYLCCSSSARRPTLLENGPSVHSTVRRVSISVPTHPRIAPTLDILVDSVHPTVSFLFLFFLVFDPWKIDYLLNLACGILHPWDLEMSTKTC